MLIRPIYKRRAGRLFTLAIVVCAFNSALHCAIAVDLGLPVPTAASIIPFYLDLPTCDSLDIVFEVVSGRLHCRDTAEVVVRNRASDTVYISIAVDGFRHMWTLFAGIDPLIENERNLVRYLTLHPVAPGGVLTIRFPASAFCRRGRRFSKFRLYLNSFAFNTGFDCKCVWVSRAFAVGR